MAEDLKFPVDRALFPFTSHFADIEGHRVHYLDEGEGPVLLMLHGNPSWSFVYRKLIRLLCGQHRCVAMDYPGYGLSVAAPGTDFSPALFSQVVEGLVDRLELRDVVVFCQDWAGPVGLGFAGRRPDLIAGLVIGNTWAWPLLDDSRVRRFSGLMGGWVGRGMAFGFNGVVRFFMREGIRSGLSRDELAMYLAPFAHRPSRSMSWQGPRALIAEAEYLESVQEGLENLATKPVLFPWAGRDFAFGESYLERFKVALPNHTVLPLPAAGHFWQEDAAERVAPAVEQLVARV